MTQTTFGADFVLKSDTLNPTMPLPLKYVYDGSGCHGKNISPELEWNGAPKETRSFALTVFDPDAPSGKGWWHWLVVNIPPATKSLEEGASNNHRLPKGALEGRTDFGRSGYGGACPPKGDKPHRYIFTVYALSVDKINIDPGSNGDEVKKNIEKNTISKASLTVKYGRKD